MLLHKALHELEPKALVARAERLTHFDRSKSLCTRRVSAHAVARVVLLRVRVWLETLRCFAESFLRVVRVYLRVWWVTMSLAFDVLLQPLAAGGAEPCRVQRCACQERSCGSYSPTRSAVLGTGRLLGRSRSCHWLATSMILCCRTFDAPTAPRAICQ